MEALGQSGCRFDRWQRGEVCLIRGLVCQTGMGSSLVVPGQVVSDRAARMADRVVGFQIDLLVFDAAPKAFDEHVGVRRQLRPCVTLEADVFR